jgi:hypothetical protein
MQNIDTGSLLVSEELIDNLELDDDVKEGVKRTLKVVVVKLRYHEDDKVENDVFLGGFRGIGIDLEKDELSIEMSSECDSATEFSFKNVQTGCVTLHGLEVHLEKSIYSYLPERDEPYDLKKVNIYDVAAGKDDATVVLTIARHT